MTSRDESWSNKEEFYGSQGCQTRRWEESKHPGTAHAWEWHREREGCLKRKEEEERKGSKPEKNAAKGSNEEGF